VPGCAATVEVLIMIRYAAIAGALLLSVTAWIVLQYRYPLVLPPYRGPNPVAEVVFLWSDVKRHPELKATVWYPANLAGRRPVLLFSPAMGRVPKDYSMIAEDLASSGYIVMGVTPAAVAKVDLEHREAMQPVVERWVGDLRFALDRLARQPLFRERIDASKVGVFGHSFGGAVALHLLAADPRVRRAANLDGALEGRPVRLERPALFILGALLPPAQRELNDRILGEIQAVCRSSPVPCRIEDRPEAGHMNFSDAGVSRPRLPWVIGRFDLTDIDGTAFLRQVTDLLKQFFDKM
jgi:predicted dienelactone hydrolase